MKQIECLKCHTIFEVPYTKRNEDRKYCSSKCAKSAIGLANKGKTHPERRTPLISIECKQCHTIFEVKYKFRKRQFCCKPCSDIYYSGTNNPSCRPEVKEKISKRVSETHWDSSGDKNPRWKGGTSTSFTYYDGKFTKKLKKTIRERDDYTCQKCGEYGNQVHHIDYNKSNCNENNLITLCVKCHGKCHGRINEQQKIKNMEQFIEV